MAHLFRYAVDTGYIDGDINHVAAQLIRGHVHRVRVGCNVDPGDHVEKEGLLHHTALFSRRRHEGGEKGGGGGKEGIKNTQKCRNQAHPTTTLLEKVTDIDVVVGLT